MEPIETSLLQTISLCTASPLTIEAIRRARGIEHGVGIVEKGVERPILFGGGKRFLLMTHRDDKKVGKTESKIILFAIDLDTAEQKCVAIATRDGCSPERWETIKQEIDIMKKCKGLDGVIQMDLAYKTDKESYVIMEFCNGGNLGGVLIALLKRHVDDRIPLKIALDAALGLKNLHAKGILHRDIKPQNIFISAGEDFVHAKIADLGSATEIKDGARMKKFTGSNAWFSPEKAKGVTPGKTEEELIPIWVKATTDKADVWALGLVFFLLFRGGVLSWQHLSHKDEDQRLINVRASQLKEGEVLEEIRNSPLNPKIKPLIEGMLQVDPKKRFGAKEVYEFLKKGLGTQALLQ